MTTVVTFKSSAFNTSEEREYFVNPGTFGDDACRWIGRRLREQGVETDAEVGQEDFGSYFNYKVPEGAHWLVGSALGGRSRGIAASALHAIHRALTGAAEIRNVRWHDKDAFDRGQEDAGREAPDPACRASGACRRRGSRRPPTTTRRWARWRTSSRSATRPRRRN
jgi:hypothetical protein